MYFSAIMVFVSEFWPYINLTLFIVAWMANGKKLSYKNRELLILILDVTGKWSFIDYFMMLMMLVGFHFVVGFN